VFGLSQRQKKILGYLREFMGRKGYPPSIRDIGAACGISSTSVVNYNLNILEREGHIRRDHDVSRGIELRGDRRKEAGTEIPLLGFIAAGSPIPVPQADTWQSAALDTISMPSDFKNQEDVYALSVKGTSMIDALIDDGDTVVLRQTQDVRDGDMVAVWLKKEMESLLKKIYFEGERVRLQPANSLMKPIYTEAGNIEIQGKVVAVIRRLEK